MLARFESVDLEHRAEWLHELREALLQHEVAEEIAVYPSLQGVSRSWDQVIAALTTEQTEAKISLDELEGADVASDAFQEAYLRLRGGVRAHAGKEEATIFRFIKAGLTNSERGEMGRSYEMARGGSPPMGAPEPDATPGNGMVRPLTALTERIRQVFRTDDDLWQELSTKRT